MAQNEKISPFLRWAGGKRWIIKHLDEIIPHQINNYHEPFLGSGALFFHLVQNKRIKGKCFLSDINQELIQTYKQVQLNPLEVAQAVLKFKNTQNEYYITRNRTYKDPIKQAARFIYLNHTSFNGIYRVNKEGKYNVPYGNRSTNVEKIKSLNAISKFLKNTILFDGDFINSKKNIKPNDLIFLDPPYTVSHNANGFIKYNQKLFSLDDQKRLSEFIDYIKSKKAYYILSNAGHEIIFDIFNKNDYSIKLKRGSLIGGLSAERKNVEEYIFTNLCC